MTSVDDTSLASIAPGAARIPSEMWAPSNAGPDAHEQLHSRPPARTVISVFVPMSIPTAAAGSSPASPVASSIATWSPPT